MVLIFLLKPSPFFKGKVKMNNRFHKYIVNLDKKHKELLKVGPVKMDSLPKDMPVGGIYLFSEGRNHLYVGRTKRKISDRLKAHVSKAIDCPFAFRIAREKTGFTKVSYFGKETRKNLLNKPEFKKAYKKAKDRIREMDIRYIGESDPIKQTLLEIYTAVVLKTPYNDFNTT